MGVRVARKHLSWYVKCLPGAAQIRQEINRENSPARVQSLIRAAFRAERRAEGGVITTLAAPAQDLNPVLNALPKPLLVVDPDGRIALVNLAAEQFFQASANGLIGLAVDELLPPDSPVLSLIRQVRRGGYSVSEHGITVETPRIGRRRVSIDLSPVSETSGDLVLLLEERSIARKLDHQLVHRHAARSVTAMAAMLAPRGQEPLVRDPRGRPAPGVGRQRGGPGADPPDLAMKPTASSPWSIAWRCSPTSGRSSARR